MTDTPTGHPRPHPYMPNSAPAVRRELLDSLGLDDPKALFEQIPPEHRHNQPFNLPPALTSELELRRHMLGLLDKNRSCEDALSFLGGGCWQHHVPAVCDEVIRRSEFLTPVWGTPASDLGRNQSWFEFTSQLGELLEMDLVALPVYSWGCAAGHALRMAARITGRNRVLIPRCMDPERRAVIATYCEPPQMASHLRVDEFTVDLTTGLADLNDLQSRLSDDCAAVYFETPSYLGRIEEQAAEIAAVARRHGTQTIAGVDPISLGVLAPPGQYGADIAVGSIQPLGIHMHGGGGLGGFIASRDEPRYAHEYPTLLISIGETHRGEHGFGMALMHQSSYGSREEGKDWTGNSTYLWAIAAAAYMALLGPEGFRELGELIVRRANYAAALLGRIDGVSIAPNQGFFKEFVLNFDATGKTVAEINARLLEYNIFGGIDLCGTFPELGQSALYCVTEIHGQADIERLAGCIDEICNT